MATTPSTLKQPLGRAIRPLFVGASSLAIAGLLGACASPPSGPSPAVGTQSKGGLNSMSVIGPLKNAESAFAEYARARHRESGLRETVQAASDEALVARHRQTIGSTDFLVAAAAESRLATARRELRMGEAATRAARSRLYRALGVNDNGMAQVSLPADNAKPGAVLLPLTLPGEAPQALPGAPL
ncbi:MAG: hypothetical protein JWN73_2204 [Betaproteobacteria bacterium]|nr:hypothetical protein [Betaproteobacteria bacterium]